MPTPARPNNYPRQFSDLFFRTATGTVQYSTGTSTGTVDTVPLHTYRSTVRGIVPDVQYLRIVTVPDNTARYCTVRYGVQVLYRTVVYCTVRVQIDTVDTVKVLFRILVSVHPPIDLNLIFSLH